MKKIILFVALLVFSCLSVQAKENRLYFTEENDRLYYESKLVDENVFMKHVDMMPGESFTDELIIENGTNTDYTLFFKVVPREQSEAANKLLDNIIMKITLDDKEIYDGKAMGLDYTNQGIDLQKAILLGKFTPSKESKMVVETKLSENYDDDGLAELSYIDWSFYAQYGKNDEPEIINPKTSTQSDNMKKLIIGLSGILTIGVVLLVVNKKKKLG